MKLTKKDLKSMVQEVINEEKQPFPGAVLPGGNVPEDEENARQNLKTNFDINRFFEGEEGDEDEEIVFEDNEVSEGDEEDEEGLPPKKDYDIPEQPGEEDFFDSRIRPKLDELTVADIVNEEIEKFVELKKKDSFSLMLEREERITKERLDEGLGEWAADAGHIGLDILGLVPGVGNLADGLNAAWYASEGRPTLAALSGLAAIPGVGHAATAGKWAKLMPNIAKHLKSVKTWAAAKGIGNAGKIIKGEKFVKSADIAHKEAVAILASIEKIPKNLMTWKKAKAAEVAAFKTLKDSKSALSALRGEARTLGAIAARKSAEKFAGIGAKGAKHARFAADFAIETQKMLGIHKGTWSGKAKQMLARTVFKQLDDTDQEEVQNLMAQASGDPYDPDTQEALMKLAQFQQKKPAGPYNADQVDQRLQNATRQMMMSTNGELVPIEGASGSLARDLEAIMNNKSPKRDSVEIITDLMAELPDEKQDELKSAILKWLAR